MFKLNNILSLLLLLLWFYDGLYKIVEWENNFPLNKFLLLERKFMMIILNLNFFTSVKINIPIT